MITRRQGFILRAMADIGQTCRPQAIGARMILGNWDHDKIEKYHWPEFRIDRYASSITTDLRALEQLGYVTVGKPDGRRIAANLTTKGEQALSTWFRNEYGVAYTRHLSFPDYKEAERTGKVGNTPI